MESSVEQARPKVREWAERHRHAVLYNEESSTVLDVASGKSVFLPWSDVKAFEEKLHPETGDSYLVLLFENGNQIALADPGGVAFAPIEVNTGLVKELPPVVCLKDFFLLKGRIDHYLTIHKDEPLPRECLDLVMTSIAILDGARRVGFDVGDLEDELEKSLREIERRVS